MLSHGARSYASVIFVALITAWSAHQVFADSPSVTAVLSNSEASIGETVQLQIRVTGGRNAEAPEDISVNGLKIHRTGTDQHIEMELFNFSSSIVYTYTILPMQAGTFKIPPQTIRVAGSSLRTPELTLHVIASGGGAAHGPTNGQRQQTLNANNIGFMELVVPKRDGYVGEILPVEIKVGARVQLVEKPEAPDMNIQGVTFQRAQDWGSASLETRNGGQYRVWTLKGAVSAIHPGKLEIPSQEAAIVALVRQRTPDFNDPFDNLFSRDPFEMMGRPTKVALHSEPVTLEIRPLPPNPPASFSGAVGNFAMTAEAKPKSVQVGDPITVTATISGRGNFDRMTAPSLEDERGWHKYPPSAKFKQDDDVGISGAKTFEMVISPNEKKSSVPPLSFSYFDPLKENYVTLRSNAIPVQVEGNTIAQAQPIIAGGNQIAQPGPAAPATSKPPDILYQLKERGREQSFAPIYTERVFWAGQIFPVIALLGFIGWKIRQAKIDNREAQRVVALQQEAAELLRKLRRKDVPPEEYFGQASRAVRVKTALAKKVDPSAVDVEMAASTFALDEESRAQLRQLFERNDELRYSGRPNGSGTTSAQDREEVLQLIESLRR